MIQTKLNIVAVVVTFNKIDLLKKVIAALRIQTRPVDTIIVVNNASTDGTDVWLEAQSGLTVLNLTENTGGSGGFNAGMKYAYDNGADWLWIMDDDCIPTPDALSELERVALREPKASFLNSLVLWTDHKPCRMNIPRPAWEWVNNVMEDEPIFPLASCSFVSCMVNASCIARVGYPIKEFFIWFDDVEYTQRLSAVQPGFLVPKSIVYHETKDHIGVVWKNVNESTLWKYCYGLRNEMSVIFHQGKMGKLRAAMRLIEIWRDLYKGRVDKKIQWKLLCSAFKGMVWNYRKNIEKP